MTRRAEMPHPSLKQRLASGDVAIGSWITLAHPAIAEILAKAGFDWVAVDLEHSVITIREAEALIRVIELCGATPLVRLSSNDPVQIKRVMDAGAQGIIVPMVNSKAEAQRAVEAVYYPPRGRRGVGLARAQGYDMQVEAYRARLEREAVVIVQIEHIDAVRRLRQILSVPGVDGYFIGPQDIAGSLGVLGRLSHPKVQRALQRIRRVARQMRVPGGVHVIPPDPSQLRQRLNEGFTLIAYSVDFLFLQAACREGLAVIRTVERRRR